MSGNGLVQRMMGGSSKESVERVDMISYLPMELFQNIFKFLPIKDVVRSSVLSKEWKNKWMRSEYINFDFESLPKPFLLSHNNEVLSNMINQVMLLHEGPISSFVIENFLFYSTTQVEQWLLKLSKRPFDKLIIAFTASNVQSLIRFTNPNLRVAYLKLANLDAMFAPSFFNSSCCFKIIQLESVYIDDYGLSLLVETSPHLHSLRIQFCYGFDNLSIASSSLQVFIYHGLPMTQSFTVDAPNLVNSVINFMRDNGNHVLVDGVNFNSPCNISFQKVEILGLGLHFLRKWSVNGCKQFPQFPMLRVLGLSLNVGCEVEIWHAFNLILGCYALQEIKLHFLETNVDAETCEHEWLSEEPKILLHHVRKMEIRAFRWLPIEVSIVRYLLLLSPLLETIDILVNSLAGTGRPMGRDPNVFKRWACPEAKITFFNWDRRFPQNSVLRSWD